jgi:hypothetical protein
METEDTFCVVSRKEEMRKDKKKWTEDIWMNEWLATYCLNPPCSRMTVAGEEEVMLGTFFSNH